MADHGDGTYDVKHDDDGSVEVKVAHKSMWVLKTPSVGFKDAMPLHQGMRVEARQQYEKPWKSGIINRLDGGIQIAYDDGSTEEPVERWRVRPHPEL